MNAVSIFPSTFMVKFAVDAQRVLFIKNWFAFFVDLLAHSKNLGGQACSLCILSIGSCCRSHLNSGWLEIGVEDFRSIRHILSRSSGGMPRSVGCGVWLCIDCISVLINSIR